VLTRAFPRKNGSNSLLIDDGGMGSPALATQSSNDPSLDFRHWTLLTGDIPSR
jgi:hypothetical protein